MANTVDYFEIGTPDAAASTAFYAGLFSWEIGPPEGPAKYAMVQGGQGGLWDTSDMGGANWAIFYVQVDDVQAPRAPCGPVARHGDRVLGEHGRAAHVALLEAHAAPVLEVDRGDDQHVSVGGRHGVVTPGRVRGAGKIRVASKRSCAGAAIRPLGSFLDGTVRQRYYRAQPRW